MTAKKMIAAACIALALLMGVTVTSARADCCYFNPLLLPFVVAGAAVSTAAAIATAPFRAYPVYYGPRYYAPAPAYYGPPPPPPPHRAAWIPGHYTRYGEWVPGHWRY